MRVLGFLFCCAALAQQTATPPAAAPRPDLSKISDSQVIAVIDGQPFTMGQYRTFTALVAPANQAMAAVDPAEFVMQLAFMRKLAAMAAQDKLDGQSPIREQLEYNRLVVLMQAEISHIINAPVVHQEELEAYYTANRERFKQVRIKAIKIAFGSPSAPANAAKNKVLSEDEAKAKAARLAAELRGGADFVKLVRENSDDQASKARDGDMQTVSPADSIPDGFRVVFQLKPGEVSEPIRQPDGYYLLRADQITYKPLSEVQQEVYDQLKTRMGGDAMETIRRNLNVQFPDPAFPPPRKKQ